METVIDSLSPPMQIVCKWIVDIFAPRTSFAWRLVPEYDEISFVAVANFLVCLRAGFCAIDADYLFLQEPVISKAELIHFSEEWRDWNANEVGANQRVQTGHAGHWRVAIATQTDWIANE